MKKTINFRLITVMIWCLGLGIVSCQDDNKLLDEKSKAQKEAEEEAAKAEKISIFWDVVGQLVSMDNYTEEYADKHFEPIIGNKDESDELTRIVATNTAVAAAERFAALVNVDDVTESTPSYEWSDPEVGILKYTKVTDGSAWATVDVDIKQIPHLTKIIYRSPEQGNTNGGVTNGGRAYYRFGDVISRNNQDGELEYWVCVRPAFDPEGKGDSHWMTVSPLPKKNKWAYTGSNNREYLLPTALGYSEEHMKNLAEMLFAICYPDEWLVNTNSYSPDIFHDFSKNNIKYHNAAFWTNVQEAWKKYSISNRLFGYDMDLKWFSDNLKTNGLYLLYKGYKWNTWFSNGPTLFQAHFVNDANTKYCNMRTPDKKAFSQISKDVIYKKDPSKDMDFNIDTECTSDKPYLVKNDFFGDSNPRWIVRYAQGKELSNTGKYANNQMSIPGVTEVYRYYRDVEPSVNLDQTPEISERRDKNLASYATDEASTYMFGDVVKDEKGNRWFCIFGAPFCPMAPEGDHTAWFVSFDFNGVNTDGPVVNGLPSEEELPEVSYRILQFFSTLSSSSGVFNYNPAVHKTKFSPVANHILEYAGVDLAKTCLCVDSIFTFTSKGERLASTSQSIITNIAYNDGNTGKQAICRLIYDYTLAGSKRTSCYAKSGKRFEDMKARAYTKYEHYDASSIRALTEDESGLGMTKWNLPWAMSDDKMYLQDVANQDVINRHAKDDKWVTLPVSVIGKTVEENNGNRRKPRTTAESSAKPSDYIGKFGTNSTPKTNIFGEPVVFMRVMKVTDNGGKQPNLTSQDGLKLTVVHLMNDNDAYKQSLHCVWPLYYHKNMEDEGYTFNNNPTTVPKIKGWDF